MLITTPLRFSILVILDFSTAVPVTNALTLLVTYLCDVIARPQLLNLRKTRLVDSRILLRSFLV